MRVPKLFHSFRTRLLLLMALLLVGTLGVQFYLNRHEQNRRSVVIAEQERALAASTAFALESISMEPPQYLWQIDEKRPVSFLAEQKGRVRNVLIVSENGRVEDSLDKKYAPTTLDDGTTKYYNLSEMELPRLVEAGKATEDIRRLMPSAPPPDPQPVAGTPRTFTIPVATVKGLNYIIIVLGARHTMESMSWWGTLQSYLPTLSVLLLATLAGAFLVWQFTIPIKELSRATHRVAAGDFSVRVPSSDRRDETGMLSSTFNEMVAQLGRMRELEAQVKQAEHSAVVGRLASAIAHEIRNPLNYINLTLDHLRTSLAPSDPTKRSLVERLTTQLKAEVARINTRISEFLNYTRPANLELRPLDLREAIADALRMVEVQAAENGIETGIVEDGALPPVLGDEASLRSVFTNLIINGMQAIEGGGGRLTVRLTSEDGRARVEVTDTGGGIAPEHLPKIFEPYFSTKETGTGLGLAIVKKAVDDHNGTIAVRSTPGEGTTFTVEIPTAGGKDEG